MAPRMGRGDLMALSQGERVGVRARAPIRSL
jgi:hypothetical protein